MIGWAEQSDRQPCCESSLGAVANDEFIARLIIKPNPTNGYTPFRRGEIFGNTKHGTSNFCGEKSGCSVLRCNSLSVTKLTELSEAQAKMKPNRTGDGARRANTGTLRKIRAANTPDLQVVFVYDDPREDQIYHAVMRGSHKIEPSDQKLIIEDIEKAFQR